MTEATVVLADLVSSTRPGTPPTASDVLRAIDIPSSVPVIRERLYENTWGDAFVAAFGSADAALEFALDVRDLVRMHDWRGEGYPISPVFRMALDSGQVYSKQGAFGSPMDFTGENFVTVSRIEPVTWPGNIFITETVKNLAGRDRYYFQSLGMRELAKAYGSLTLFRAFRREEMTAVASGVIETLRDDQYFRRASALRRFAFLWLVLDQLPRGSWGRSVPGWMTEVWRGATSFVPGPLMEDEGGFESTVLNLYLLAEILGVDGLRRYNRLYNAAMRYIQERHAAGGFGTLELSREGAAVQPRPRHSAFVAWLVGCKLGADPDELDLFRKAIEALFIQKDLDATRNEFLEDRNPLMLYSTCWHVLKRLYEDPRLRQLFAESELRGISERWENCGGGLLDKGLESVYTDGVPEKLAANRGSISPLILPYSQFVRMETYTLLTVAALIHAEMPTRLRGRLQKAIEFIVNDYLKTAGNPMNRYSREPLQAKVRGPKPHYAPENIHPDLGTASLLLRLLRNRSFLAALWGDTPPRFLKLAAHLLSEDLTDQFDRYLLHPELFSLLHPGMLAGVLCGDHEDLRKKETSQCEEALSRLPQDLMSDETIDEVLSEQKLERLVNDVVGKDNVEDIGIQMSVASLVSLLVNRLRPGRYLRRRRLSDGAIQRISDQTIEVYGRKEFVDLYAEAWGSPDKVIVAGALDSLPRKSVILDVGCGPGQYAEEFARYGHQVDLLDVSESMLEVASRRLSQYCPSHKKFRVNVLDVFGLGQVASREHYDAVWCSGVFPHVPKEAQPGLLAWFHRILRQDGLLFVNVMLDDPRVVARDRRFYEYVPGPQEFATVLEGSGFRIDSTLVRRTEEKSYFEPFASRTWANFYARKRTAERTANLGDIAASLTSLAYERSLAEFSSVHVVSEERAKEIRRKIEVMDSHFKQYFEGDPEIRVLDAGCGPGDQLAQLADRGWRAIGIDICPRMIETARATCSRFLGRGLEVSVRDMRRLPDDWTNTFHAVVCVTAFQHIPSKDGTSLRLLKEFNRVLRQCGLLWIDHQIGRDSGFDPDLRYIRKISDEQEAIGEFSDAGFSVIGDPPSWALESGRNAFGRKTELLFVGFWLRKERNAG